MELTKEELKELLFASLYRFVVAHPEIKIEHYLPGNDAFAINTGNNIYACDRSHANSFISGYKVALEEIKIQEIKKNLEKEEG